MSRGRSVKPPTGEERPVWREQALALLARALGFRDCAPTTLHALVDAGVWRSLARGEVLARRGEPFDNLCLVVAGSLEASLLRHDGHRHLVGLLQPGDVLGMISMQDHLGHVNDLSARANATVVLRIPGPEIRRLRQADPALPRAFEQQLAFRSRMLYERLASDPSMPLELRLVRLLQTLREVYGQPVPQGVLLQLKISQSDLGDWLGVSRQRANFAVQQLRKDGMIELRYSTITITDPQRLAACARL